jgi:hypothetical protein
MASGFITLDQVATHTAVLAVRLFPLRQIRPL